jgi:trimeric autotransporter adhesin
MGMKRILTFLFLLSSMLGLSGANPSFTDMWNALPWTNDTLNLRQRSASDLGITGSVFNISIGRSNVGVGPNALKENERSNNIAIGAGSMRFAFDAFDEVGIGTGTLTNDHGNKNVAVGHYSMERNDNGFQNVAVGHAAMQSNQTATLSVAIGYEALKNGRFLDENTAVGHRVMTALTSGFQNTGIGRGAMDLQTSSFDCTALGWGTLDKMTGSGNTAVGSAVLGGATGSGSYNTLIGYQAGRNAADLDGVISIGKNTFNGVSSKTNSVAIGNDTAITRNGEMVFGNGISNYVFAGYQAQITEGGVITTNGYASYSTNATIVVFTTGITNTTGRNYRLFGLTGTSILQTNLLRVVGFSRGTITAPSDIVLQPNEFVTGTSIAVQGSQAF